jgi:hypothetical protein
MLGVSPQRPTGGKARSRDELDTLHNRKLNENLEKRKDETTPTVARK